MKEFGMEHAWKKGYTEKYDECLMKNSLIQQTCHLVHETSFQVSI